MTVAVERCVDAGACVFILCVLPVFCVSETLQGKPVVDEVLY